jgi:hypothetical protein
MATRVAAGGRTEHSVGEVLRGWLGEYSRTHPLSSHQRRVSQALAECRTAALGGHLETCDDCGYEQPVYNSCGNRHCPVCQGKLARQWLEDRLEDVLETPYFHTVFTLPDSFNVLVPYNERTVYELLFQAAAETLLRFARRELGGVPGVVAVLHTWGQTLWLHPHVHCIVTGGALSPDRRQWHSSGATFLFDVRELSAAFRDRFCALLRRAHAKLELRGESAHLAAGEAFAQFMTAQETRDWVVYCKRPVRGPAQVLEYISRYTHRVAVANRRILDVAPDGTVTLQYKDYREQDAAGRPADKTLELSATDFIGRFLRHILPPGFRKVRSYGILAGRDRQAKIAAARSLLGPVAAPPAAPDAEPPAEPQPDPTLCPRCGKGHLVPTATLRRERGPPLVLPWLAKTEGAAA